MTHNHQLEALLFLIILAYTTCQPQCNINRLPRKIPLRASETNLINLEEYFVGNNLTFSIIPNNSYSYIHQNYECSQVKSERIGNVTASKYHSIDNEHYLSTLASSLLNSKAYSFYLFSLQNTTIPITVLDLPLTIQNCTSFDLKFWKKSFQLVVDCKVTNRFFTRVLLVTNATIGQSLKAKWQEIQVPLYSYSADNFQTEVSIFDNMLVRSIFSPYNSYIQLWIWSSQGRDLISITDRISLNLRSFYIKAVQLSQDLYFVLDYNSGIHIFRILEIGILSSLRVLRFQFYESFNYDASTSLVYLAKKGKVLTTKLQFITQNTIVETISIADSFHIYKYQKIKGITILENNLVVIGSSMLNIYSLSSLKNLNEAQKGQYMIYPSRNTINVFVKQQNHQRIELYIIRNAMPQITIETCVFEWPILYISAPFQSQQVVIEAKSIIDNQSINCLQQISLQRFAEPFDLIFDNGYVADNQNIYANLPGKGEIELSKYGIGRNIKYQIIPNKESKINYDVVIRKNLILRCQIQQVPINPANQFYWAKSQGRLLVIQFYLDYTLRYMLCDEGNNITCTFLKDFNNFSLIDQADYYQINDITTYQILTQMDHDNLVLHVRVIKINSDETKPSAQFITICKIQFSNVTNNGFNLSKAKIFNNHLYILFPFRKQIRIYTIFSNNTCSSFYTMLNTELKWGYFSPKDFYFNQDNSNQDKSNMNSREIVYIQQFDQILVVQIITKRNQIKPVLINKNYLPNIINTTIIVSNPYLIYFNKNTSLVIQYYIDQLYSLRFLRQVPLNGLKLSSLGNRISNESEYYIRMLDKDHLAVKLFDPISKNYSIAIFKLDEIVSTTMQYLSFGVSSNQMVILISYNTTNSWLKLQILKGTPSSYILCKGIQTMVKPIAELRFKDSIYEIDSYTEDITLSLSTKDQKQSHKFKVTVSNMGNAVSRGPLFPPRGAARQALPYMQINDSKWFTGSVFGFTYDCYDCDNGRIKISNKITVQQQQQIEIDENDFWISDEGNKLHIVKNNSMIDLQRNHTVWPLETSENLFYDYTKTTRLSDSSQSLCTNVIFSNQTKMIVSLCVRFNSFNVKETWVSLVSTASFKGFVVDSIRLDIQASQGPAKMVLKDSLIIVYTTKSLIIMSSSLNSQSLQLIELQHIDEEDIGSTICHVDLITNGTDSLLPDSKIYSLLITSCDLNVQYITFNIFYQVEEYLDDDNHIQLIVVPNIHISNSQQINVKSILSSRHIQIPTESTIVQSLLKKQESPYPLLQDFYSLITIFDKFHSYHFKMILNKKSGALTSLSLDGIYYKFGEYRSVSAQYEGYLAIKYVLESDFGKLDQMYGLFEENNYIYNSDFIKQHHFFEAYSLRRFNGMQGSAEIKWKMRGHKIYQISNQRLTILNITNIIRIYIKQLEAGNENSETLYSQNLLLIASNPNSARSANILLKNVDKIILTSVQIFLIVIGGLAFFIFFIVFGRIAYKKYDARRKLVPLLYNQNLQDAELDPEEFVRVQRKSQINLQGQINYSDRESLQDKIQ